MCAYFLLSIALMLSKHQCYLWCTFQYTLLLSSSLTHKPSALELIHCRVSLLAGWLCCTSPRTSTQRNADIKLVILKSTIDEPDRFNTSTYRACEHSAVSWSEQCRIIESVYIIFQSMVFLLLWNSWLTVKSVKSILYCFFNSF